MVRTAHDGPQTGASQCPRCSSAPTALRAELFGFAVELLDDVVLTVGSGVDVSITLRVRIRHGAVHGRGGRIVHGRHPKTASPASCRNSRSTVFPSRPGSHVVRPPHTGRERRSRSEPGRLRRQRSSCSPASVPEVEQRQGRRPRPRRRECQECRGSRSARKRFVSSRCLTSSYSAEFGKAAGGVLNIITRSGTNVFGGNIVFLLQGCGAEPRRATSNASLRPAIGIDREKAPFHQKEFGATFGGPLKKDRSFIFLSYERLDLRATNLVTIDDSTVIADPSGGPPIGTPAGILRRAGFPIETGHVPLSVRNTGVFGKVDHRFSASQHLAVRANFADVLDDTVEPWGGLVAKSRGAMAGRNRLCGRGDPHAGGHEEPRQRGAMAVRRARSDRQRARPDVPAAVHRRVPGRADADCGRHRRRGTAASIRRRLGSRDGSRRWMR